MNQASFFDLPTHTYNDHAPYRASETSAAGAKQIEPKRATLQRRVLLALYATPGLTCRALDRLLGTSVTRSAWPRVTELSKARLIQQCGQCLEETGQAVSMWELTAKGLELARSLEVSA